MNRMDNIVQRMIGTFRYLLNLEEPEQEVWYIGGADVLPSPLEPEQENACIEKLSGEGRETEEAKSLLIEHNLRLVVYIAKKFDNTGVGVEDLISIGTIGLIKAINTFNPTKNIKLATYASRCIENEILMQLRKNTRTKNEISLDEPLSNDGEGNELLLADIISIDEESVSKNLEVSSEKQILMSILSKLDTREQMIMHLRFGLVGNEEKTQKEVADMMGISQSYISRIEKKILGKLRKKLEKVADL